MKYPVVWKTLSPLFGVLLLVACDTPTQSSNPVATEVSIEVSADAQLKNQVESAIARASDLPPGLSVGVSQGTVTISGALACEECGGLRTPANVGTIQQSLGAIVRAVPGVSDVEFSLSYAN